MPSRTLILISFDGFRWDYRTTYLAAQHEPAGGKGRERGPDSELSLQDLPQPLHHRHRPLSRTPRHRRQHGQGPADRPSPVDEQQHRERRRDVVGRRADLGHGAARGSVVGGDVLAGLRGAHRRPPAELLGALRHSTVQATARVDRVLAWLDLPAGRAADAPDALLQRRRWRRPQQWARIGGRADGGAPRRRLPGTPAARPGAAPPDRQGQHRHRLGSRHGRDVHEPRRRPR